MSRPVFKRKEVRNQERKEEAKKVRDLKSEVVKPKKKGVKKGSKRGPYKKDKPITANVPRPFKNAKVPEFTDANVSMLQLDWAFNYSTLTVRDYCRRQGFTESEYIQLVTKAPAEEWKLRLQEFQAQATARLAMRQIDQVVETCAIHNKYAKLIQAKSLDLLTNGIPVTSRPRLKDAKANTYYPLVTIGRKPCTDANIERLTNAMEKAAHMQRLALGMANGEGATDIHAQAMREVKNATMNITVNQQFNTTSEDAMRDAVKDHGALAGIKQLTYEDLQEVIQMRREAIRQQAITGVVEDDQETEVGA